MDIPEQWKPKNALFWKQIGGSFATWVFMPSIGALQPSTQNALWAERGLAAIVEISVRAVVEVAPVAAPL